MLKLADNTSVMSKITYMMCKQKFKVIGVHWVPRDGWDAGKLQSAGWKNSKVCKTNPVFENGNSLDLVECKIL